MTQAKTRAIAFHLPQFHPVPENDEWWGKGFTEWTNVTKAKPLFEGHYQPQLPSDLGFYDLRLPEVREEQAALAQEYGIYGFCYYHYWFSGRRILELPVDAIVKSGKPELPFCLCWANENWTRRWDGEDQHILLQQIYSAEDDLAHLRVLAKYFNDPRYIRVNGKPLFLIYRASNLPDPAGTVARWRAEGKRLGFPGLYLCNVESSPRDKGIAKSANFDAGVEFSPDGDYLPARLRPPKRNFLQRVLRDEASTDVWEKNYIYDYDAFRDRMLTKPDADYLRFPGVIPSWDNSARKRELAYIFRDATPEAYEKWLAALVKRFKPPTAEENFIFINAWNEWGEGNHLEPCRRWGRKYLEATKRALGGDSQQEPGKPAV
jgi:lipopolysaccharide biosynthesis protein